LRDYGIAGQIGLEPTMHEYLDTMVLVFRECRRVLKPEGTCWLNIGDSYAANREYQVEQTKGGPKHGPAQAAGGRGMKASTSGLKAKDLCMIQNQLAILLQDDGWFVRSEVIWHKPNPMPESVMDRPSCSHEKVWMLSKSERYAYDRAAVARPLAASSVSGLDQDIENQAASDRANGGAKTNGRMKTVKFGGENGQGEQGSASRRASGNE
jgi:DNA methylase